MCSKKVTRLRRCVGGKPIERSCFDAHLDEGRETAFRAIASDTGNLQCRIGSFLGGSRYADTLHAREAASLRRSFSGILPKQEVDGKAVAGDVHGDDKVTPPRGLLVPEGNAPGGRRRELWCLAHAMTVAAAVALWHRAHFYKAIACVVLALIAIQYLLSGVLDRRSIETIFTINATRYADRSYRNHPRGLIIYGPATASSLLGNNNVSSTMYHWPAKGQENFSKFDASSARNTAATAASQELSTTITGNNATLQRCPLIPLNLVGAMTVTKSPPELSRMEQELAEVDPGGKAAPKSCIAGHRVAIIIPFRDRPQHLQALLYNLHPMLLRQQIDYQIFVVEQEGTGPFNRAMLMNVGYVEALKERTFDCFIFHDVDLLPEDDRNLYTCPEQPRHMSVAVDSFKYKLPYPDLFGGVSAMSREQFRLVNGFSNVFWGWGGEDDDMANRIKAHGLHISRYPANVARYKMLMHKKEKANPKRYEFLKTGKKRFATDGLSNLRYELIDKQKPKLYTWLLVRLTPPQPS
ncbi:hypothetical protein KM043_001641 [Ampulex compressa]|nr:hypothetical protein KM043_001641 [Ampulex compressa]